MGQLSSEAVAATVDAINAAPSLEHALGHIHTDAVDLFLDVRNWTTSFAFLHVFYRIMEDRRELLTWSQLRAELGDARYREMIWVPAQHMVADQSRQRARQLLHDAGTLRPTPAQVEQQAEEAAKAVRQAMQWRIGNVYLSFIREQYVAAKLREEFGDVGQHPLADVLFRTDCWVGNTNIDIFIPNKDYRSTEGSGRKVAGPELLRDAQPPFNSVEIVLPIQHVWGTVHLPTRRVVEQAISALRRLM